MHTMQEATIQRNPIHNIEESQCSTFYYDAKISPSEKYANLAHLTFQNIAVDSSNCEMIDLYL